MYVQLSAIIEFIRKWKYPFINIVIASCWCYHWCTHDWWNWFEFKSVFISVPIDLTNSFCFRITYIFIWTKMVGKGLVLFTFCKDRGKININAERTLWSDDILSNYHCRRRSVCRQVFSLISKTISKIILCFARDVISIQTPLGMYIRIHGYGRDKL